MCIPGSGGVHLIRGDKDASGDAGQGLADSGNPYLARILPSVAALGKARLPRRSLQRCMHKNDLRRSAVVYLMADETKSSSDGSPPEPKSLLGLESEGRPELITVEAEPEIVSPRVTRASLPPVALENGALECPVRPRVRFRPRASRKLGAAVDFYTNASSS